MDENIIRIGISRGPALEFFFRPVAIAHNFVWIFAEMYLI